MLRLVPVLFHSRFLYRAPPLRQALDWALRPPGPSKVDRPPRLAPVTAGPRPRWEADPGRPCLHLSITPSCRNLARDPPRCHLTWAGPAWPGQKCQHTPVVGGDSSGARAWGRAGAASAPISGHLAPVRGLAVPAPGVSLCFESLAFGGRGGSWRQGGVRVRRAGSDLASLLPAL